LNEKQALKQAVYFGYFIGICTLNTLIKQWIKCDADSRNCSEIDQNHFAMHKKSLSNSDFGPDLRENGEILFKAALFF
jgi:hypothetical protein